MFQSDRIRCEVAGKLVKRDLFIVVAVVVVVERSADVLPYSLRCEASNLRLPLINYLTRTFSRSPAYDLYHSDTASQRRGTYYNAKSCIKQDLTAKVNQRLKSSATALCMTCSALKTKSASSVTPGDSPSYTIPFYT